MSRRCRAPPSRGADVVEQLGDGRGQDGCPPTGVALRDPVVALALVGHPAIVPRPVRQGGAVRRPWPCRRHTTSARVVQSPDRRPAPARAGRTGGRPIGPIHRSTSRRGRPRPRAPRRSRPRRLRVRRQHRVARCGDAARGLAGAPSGTGSGSARRLAADLGAGPRGVRRRPRRPVPGGPGHARRAGLPRRLRGGDVGAARHAPGRLGHRWDGGVDARGRRGGRTTRGGRGPDRAGHGARLGIRARGPLVAAAHPRPAHRPAAGPHLRGALRLGRPDLPARAGRSAGLAARSRLARRPRGVHARMRVAGGGPPDGRGDRHPAVRARLAGCGRPDAARDRRGPTGDDGGDRRPGDRGRGHRPVRRAPDRLPVRWPEHARGGRHDLQRLRAAGLLRARRGGLPGGRGRRRPRDDRRAPDPAVSRGAPCAHRADRGRARVRRAPAPPLPGCLRLDGAPAVRPDDDRGPRGDAGRHGDPGAGRTDALDGARSGGHRSRLAGRAQPRRAGGFRGGTERGARHRPEPRPARRPRQPRRGVPRRPPR